MARAGPVLYTSCTTGKYVGKTVVVPDAIFHPLRSLGRATHATLPLMRGCNGQRGQCAVDVIVGDGDLLHGGENAATRERDAAEAVDQVECDY